MFIWTNLKLSLLIYFLLYYVKVDLHKLVWAPETRIHQEIAISFVCWFKTVSEDELSKFLCLKRL